MSMYRIIALLDEYYSRYTVVESIGKVEFHLPLARRGPPIPFEFGYRLDQMRPVSIQFTAVKLPWYKNWIRRRRLFSFCEVVSGSVESVLR